MAFTPIPIRMTGAYTAFGRQASRKDISIGTVYFLPLSINAYPRLIHPIIKGS